MEPFFVGIAGGSGSGKTTIVEHLVQCLGDSRATVIEHDSYYLHNPDLPFKEREKVNYDHPASLETELLVEHIGQLRSQQPIEAPIYDFTRHKRRDQRRVVEPKPFVIVEGILVLAEAKLRDALDLRVFVDTDDDLRLIRRLRRDRQERERSTESVLTQYLNSVKPMYQRYVGPSQQHAEIVLRGDGDLQLTVRELAASLDSAR